MSSILFLVLGIVIAIGGLKLWDSFWSFRAQKLETYTQADAGNTASLAEWFNGAFSAHGVIYDYSGHVRARFSAEIEGEIGENSGRLRETFAYSSGRVDRREWTIRHKNGDRRFTATAPDIIGEASGEISGDAIRITYRLRLPEQAGGHVLDVVDWLYRLDDGAIVNRSEMRKFGFKAAELVAVFRPSSSAATLAPGVAAE